MKRSIAIRANAIAPVVYLVTLACATGLAQTKPTSLDVAELAQVVISASRFEQPRSAASVVVDVIDRVQIERSGASNIVELLEAVPGVSVNKLYGRAGVDATVDIGSLGFSGGQNVLILIDGQRVNNFDSADVVFSQVPLSGIERIEVRKANGGALYGDRAQGGVINIITRTDASKEVGLSVGSFGHTKSDAYLGFKQDSLSGGVSVVSAKSEAYRRFNDSKQESVQLKLNHASEAGKVSLLARKFAEDANLPSYLTQAQFKSDPRQVGRYPVATERNGDAVGVKYERVLSDEDVFLLDVLQQSSNNKTYDPITNKRTSVSSEFRTKWKDNQVLLGADFFDAEANTEQKKQVGQKSTTAYIQVIQSVSPRMSVDGGMRHQHVESQFQIAEGGAISTSTDSKNGASIGTRWQLSEKSYIRLGGFTGFRFPNADELYYFNRSTYALNTINPNIKPMATREYSAQLESRNHLGVISAHYRNIKSSDEISYQYDCGTVAGIVSSCNSNVYDTERSVLSFSSELWVSGALTLKGSFDFADATISSGADAGRRIPMTPKKFGRLMAEKKYQNLTFMATANYRGNMAQAADSSNSDPLIPARTVLDVGVKSALTKQMIVSAWIRNVTNKSFYDYATYNGLYPADGRGIFLGVKATF